MNETSFSYCNTTSVFLYEKPRENLPIITQLYYSEPVDVLQEKEGWLQLRSHNDGYLG